MMSTFEFTDSISQQIVTLHMGESAGVEHPGCAYRANVYPDFDAFFCAYCGWNGRISGAWFMDLLNAESQR